MPQPNEAEIISISETIARGIFEAESRPNHDQKWEEITSAEAPLIGAAIVRARSHELLGTAANEAYLQGIADALAFTRRQQLARQVLTEIQMFDTLQTEEAA